VRCKRCGLIYVNPRPTVEAIGYYYPPSYEPYILPGVDPTQSSWRQWLQAYNLNKRCRAVARYKKSGRILDVGCATGRFLRQMKQWASGIAAAWN